MGLVPPRQLFALNDESVFSNGLKGSFSILGNASLDFKELACSLYFFFFPWFYTPDMLHFQNKKCFFLWMCNHCSPTANVCICNAGKGRLFILPICVRMCCLRGYCQQWICRAHSVLFTASGGHASGWLLPKWNFNGPNVPWMQAVPPQLDQQSQVNHLSPSRCGWRKVVTTLLNGEMKALLTFSSLGGGRGDFC